MLNSAWMNTDNIRAAYNHAERVLSLIRQSQLKYIFYL